MREIGQTLAAAKERVSKLKDIPLIIKVTGCRKKANLYRGSIVAVFPAVFSVKTESGELKTFSYADVQTKSVAFLKPDEKVERGEKSSNVD